MRLILGMQCRSMTQTMTQTSPSSYCKDDCLQYSLNCYVSLLFRVTDNSLEQLYTQNLNELFRLFNWKVHPGEIILQVNNVTVVV
jgi:UV DNA damage repair endonuclease